MTGCRSRPTCENYFVPRGKLNARRAHILLAMASIRSVARCRVAYDVDDWSLKVKFGSLQFECPGPGALTHNQWMERLDGEGVLLSGSEDYINTEVRGAGEYLEFMVNAYPPYSVCIYAEFRGRQSSRHGKRLLRECPRKGSYSRRSSIFLNAWKAIQIKRHPNGKRMPSVHEWMGRWSSDATRTILWPQFLLGMHAPAG